MQGSETVGAIASYSKIAEALCKEIRAGVYSDEGPFPSLTKIMQRFGVSRPSAVRSVAELKRLGLVTTRKGAGAFVSQRNRTIGLGFRRCARGVQNEAVAHLCSPALLRYCGQVD